MCLADYKGLQYGGDSDVLSYALIQTLPEGTTVADELLVLLACGRVRYNWEQRDGGLKPLSSLFSTAHHTI